jgi:hypothetical protein
MKFIVCLQFIHMSMIVRHIQIQSGVLVGRTDIIMLLFCGHVSMQFIVCLQFTHTSMIVRDIQIQSGVWVGGTDNMILLFCGHVIMKSPYGSRILMLLNIKTINIIHKEVAALSCRTSLC